MYKKIKIPEAVISIVMCVMLIINAKGSADAAELALKRCLGVMIPSLFAFMAASEILVRSGGLRIISLPFGTAAKYIFKMPGELFSVMLISNIAGFPVGASMISQLVSQGRLSKRDASVLSCCCYGGGPSFAIGVIGLYLYGDKNVGLVIWASAAAANLIMALVLNRFYKLSIKEKTRTDNYSGIIIASAEKAGRNMLMICGLIILFSVLLTNVGEALGFLDRFSGSAANKDVPILLKSVFEISVITQLSAAKIGYIPIIAAMFSFGGVCVLMQTVAASCKEYPLSPFFMSRIPALLITFIIAKLITPFFVSAETECFAARGDAIVNINNFVPSICLILMIFLLLFKKRVAFSKDI